MSRVRDIANILSGGSSAIATDAEIPSYLAGKNFVINGGFDIWQRGTSFVSPFNTYTTDRWSNDTTNMTISRQSSGAPSGSLYYLRTTSTSSSAFTDFYHFFETANVSALWGKTVTYSFKVRKSGTAPIGSFILTLQKSATIDAGRGSTWTTVVSASTAFNNISTGTSSNDWTTVTATATIPNDGSANSLRFIGGFDNAQASGVVVDIAQVQLEAGSVITPFSRAGGDIQGELMACQRYYWRTNTNDSTAYGVFGLGYTYASNLGLILVNFPITMRAVPSNFDYQLHGYINYNNAGRTLTSISVNQSTRSSCWLQYNITGGVQGEPAFVQMNNGSGYLGFSAEL